MKTHSLIAATILSTSLFLLGQANAASQCSAPLPSSKSIALVKNFYEAFNTKNKNQTEHILPAKIWVAPAQKQYYPIGASNTQLW